MRLPRAAPVPTSPGAARRSCSSCSCASPPLATAALSALTRRASPPSRPSTRHAPVPASPRRDRSPRPNFERPKTRGKHAKRATFFRVISVSQTLRSASPRWQGKSPRRRDAEERLPRPWPLQPGWRGCRVPPTRLGKREVSPRPPSPSERHGVNFEGPKSCTGPGTG